MSIVLKELTKELRAAVAMLLVMTLITGFAYPLLVTGVAQLVFREKANGSLIVRDGKPLGSALISQPFGDPKYFSSRPSATSPYPYNAAASSGSNLGPTNPALAEGVKARIDALRTADPQQKAAVPVDLVTASASGLDPDISPAAATFQVARVASARHLPEQRVRELVAAHTSGRQWGALGEPRVTVLQLNLALDGL